MRNIILKFAFRAIAIGIILLGSVIGIVLNPSLLYAHKSDFGNYYVYHNTRLDPNFNTRVEDALEIIKQSELYDSKIKFDICLNDGTIYPALLEVFLGKAFALGYTSNKIAICGDMNADKNYVGLHEYKWNLTQLIAHEATHCLVYNRVGFWKSNPVANHPFWKWEGYPEYISRLDSSQNNLVSNIEQFDKATTENKDAWEITLTDGTITTREYFRIRLLYQYCIDVKKMTFINILKDTTTEQSITNEMNRWFVEQKQIEQLQSLLEGK